MIQKVVNILMVFLLFISSVIVKPVHADEKTRTVPKEYFSFAQYGDNASETRNPAPEFELTENDEISKIIMLATGGKISGKSEGLSFLYTEVKADENFKLSADIFVDSFNENTGISSPKQKSFGITLRDSINTKTDGHLSLGVVEENYQIIHRKEGEESFESLKNFNIEGKTMDKLRLSIVKYGDDIQLQMIKDGEVYHQVLDSNILKKIDSKSWYLGFYVARDAKITISDIELEQNIDIKEDEIDFSLTNNKFIIGESFDWDRVNAFYKDEKIAITDLILKGFDTSQVGEFEFQIKYRGNEKSFSYIVEENSIIDLVLDSKPYKLDYILGEEFDPKGLKVQGKYLDGTVKELTEDQYKIILPTEFTKEIGKHKVEILSLENEEIKVDFDVNVKDVELDRLELTKDKAFTTFYVGDQFDPRGLLVEALYSDGSKQRLSRNEYEIKIGENSGLANEFLYTFDDADVGHDLQVEIVYKNKQASYLVKVESITANKLVIENYPTTTFNVNTSKDEIEATLKEELVLGIEYNNGKVEKLDPNDYGLIIPEELELGANTIEVNCNNLENFELKSISFDISLIEDREFEWKVTYFGQSTKETTNIVEVKDGHVNIQAKEGGGKITADQDGISYYYTELDAEHDNFLIEATIKVNDYAKKPKDGQESFGIMVRDAIGELGDSSVFASNIAAVGGYSGGSSKPNGIQLFARTGVLSSDGLGSEGIQNVMLQEGDAISTFKLSLRKTNSGFEARSIDLSNGGKDSGWQTIYAPNILNVQDDKMYIGFYTARLADIEVSDIQLSTSVAKTDAPMQDAPIVYYDLEIDNSTRTKTANQNENIRIISNADGILYVNLDKSNGEREQFGPFSVKKDELFTQEIMLSLGNNKLMFRFIPDEFEPLLDYNENLFYSSIDYRKYYGDIHVSPTGLSNNKGTEDSPLDIYTAIEFSTPGQKILLEGGEYHLDKTLHFVEGNNGVEGKRKLLWAKSDQDRPILNFGKKVQGVRLAADYWHLKNIDVTQSAGNTVGVLVGGNHNILEGMKTYRNGDTGLQISRTNRSNHIEDWPSYNLILNSSSYDNQDPSNNNADGFAAKLTVGEGNKFKGCVAYNNIDDGWDLYTKVGLGAIGKVTIEDSIAYNNGWVSHDPHSTGDGNGFKLGGEGVRVQHQISNSIAFNNLTEGLTSNSNPGVIVDNVIAFNNGSSNVNLSTYKHIQEDFEMNNIYSFRFENKSRQLHTNSNVKDQYPIAKLNETTYLFDGKTSMNSEGKIIKDKFFENIDPVTIQRDVYGNLIEAELPRLKNIQITYNMNDEIELEGNESLDEIINKISFESEHEYELELLSPLEELIKSKEFEFKIIFYPGTIFEEEIVKNVRVSKPAESQTPTDNDNGEDETPTDNDNGEDETPTDNDNGEDENPIDKEQDQMKDDLDEGNVKDNDKQNYETEELPKTGVKTNLISAILLLFFGIALVSKRKYKF